MKNTHFLIFLVPVGTLLMSAGVWAQFLGKGLSEADVVRKALGQADRKDVTVSDDAGKNTLT